MQGCYKGFRTNAGIYGSRGTSNPRPAIVKEQHLMARKIDDIVWLGLCGIGMSVLGFMQSDPAVRLDHENQSVLAGFSGCVESCRT